MRILVVDDDLGSRLIAETIVKDLGHECVSAVDGDEAWRLFSEFVPDAVVTDRQMPGLDGLELCRRIRSIERDGYTYIILVTSLSNPTDVLEGMHAGADDYVGKPLSPLHLQARLLVARRVTDLHAELGRARAELTRQANTDPLTGLHNRLSLTRDLEQLHRLSQRYGRSYCLALCDVDFFKRYNDTYGHPAGDVVLQTVAATLRAGIRDVDRAYRYGGEEFLILLPEQTVDGARIAVQRLLDDIESLAVEHRTGGPTRTLTMSAGIADWAPGSPLTDEALLAEADRALYAAKAAGRNRISSADEATRGRTVPTRS